MDEINDINDLIRILREQPDWADILRGILFSRDMLKLPVQLAELTQHVDQLAQHVDQLAQATGENTRQISELAQQLAEFIRETRANNLVTNRRLDEHYQKFNLIEGRLGNLEGSDYERKVRYRVLSRARNRFTLNNPYLALTQNDPEAPQLSSAVARAVNSGAISRDEADDLINTDIIISDQDNRHIAAEVSLTAGNNDIARAKARAEVLSNATGGAVTPLVVTAILEGPQHDLAIAEGVDTLILPYP